MRRFFSRLISILSRFATPIIVLGVGAYFITGTLVQGGQGPGNGEKPVLSLLSHKSDTASAETGTVPISEREPNEPDPALTIAQREAGSTGASAPVRSVQVKTFIAQAMPINVPLRGQTKPNTTITASAETTGTVASVNVVKGQAVKVGDLLCTLDPETRKAAVAQAEGAVAQANANLAQAQADYDTNQTLIGKGAATPNSARALQVSLAAAKANVSAAQAGLDNANAELGRTRIIAKAPGVVTDPIASVGSVLSAAVPGSATCATIVQLDPILFSGAVPEVHINLARTGLPATVTTVAGQTLTGTVSYVSAVADAATRTFDAEITLPNPGNKVPAGLTATASINVGTAPAQLLPQSVLTLDDEGTMGVRVVEDSKVVFLPVTIVNDAREGMYVTGLPLKVDVITVGQEFVKAGDTVKAVEDTGTSDAGKTPAAANVGAPS